MKADNLKEIRFTDQEKEQMKRKLVQRKRRSDRTVSLAMAGIVAAMVVLPTIGVFGGGIKLDFFVRELYGAEAQITSVRTLSDEEAREYNVTGGNYFVFSGEKGGRNLFGVENRAILCQAGTVLRKLFYRRSLSVATAEALDDDEFSIVLEAEKKSVNSFYHNLYLQYQILQKDDEYSLTNFKSERELRKDFENYLSRLNLSKGEERNLIKQVDVFVPIDGEHDYTKKYQLDYSFGSFSIVRRENLQSTYNKTGLVVSWEEIPVTWDVFNKTILTDRLYCMDGYYLGYNAEGKNSPESGLAAKSVDISLTVNGETLFMHYDLPRRYNVGTGCIKEIEPFHIVEVGGRQLHFRLTDSDFYLIVADGKGDIRLGGEDNLTYSNGLGYVFTTTSQETLDFWNGLEEIYGKE